MTDHIEPDGGEPADDDFADGPRDPLTTDDGLAAAAETMPEVEQRDGEDVGEDAREDRELVDEPDLDVTDDGDDPCATDAGDEG